MGYTSQQRRLGVYILMKIGGDGEEYLLLLREEKIAIGDITSGHCHIDPHVLLLLFYFLIVFFFSGNHYF